MPIDHDGLIESRLLSLAEQWPTSLRSAIETYLDTSKPQTSKGVPKSPSDQPYWLLLPDWTLASWSQSAEDLQLPQDSIDDIHWAQYCLFLFVRLQDDLFDDQASDNLLIYASDLLLLEADRTFSRQFDRTGRFWDIYRERLETTIKAIADVFHIQQATEASDPRLNALAEAYSRVSAVLMISSIAVTMKLARDDEIPRIKQLADCLAVIGQIFDDLLDMEEDLASGRLNLAASRILAPDSGPVNRTLDSHRDLFKGLLLGTGLRALLDEVRAQIGRAQEATARMHLKPAMQYLSELSDSVDDLEASFHQKRVKLLLGSLI